MVNKPRHTRLLPAALCALAVFLALNFALSWAAGKRTSNKPEQQAAIFRACDSALDQFAHTINPDIVVMGSSLVMAPLWSVDRQSYPDVADVYQHHLSRAFQDKLLKNGSQSGPVFSFALPGAMVSDIYLIADKLFKGDKTPRLVIYGLAPRDFMDDLLTGETRTAVFQRLMDLSDLPRLGDRYLTSFKEKAEFLMNNLVYLYGKRWRYQDKAYSACRGVLGGLTHQSASCSSRVSTAGAEQRFLLEVDRKQTWARSVDEYRKRYAHFRAEQFTKQLSFLRELTSLARERGFRLMLVNMPLTQENVALMPPGLYERYRSAVRNTAAASRVEYIDLQSAGGFTPAQFYDTVHLNAAGGSRFIEVLADWLGNHPQQQVASRRL